MAKYLIEKIKGKKKRVWSSGRNRGLNELSQRIGNILPPIDNLLKIKKKYGEKIQTYGINYEKDWNLDLIKKFGMHQKLFSKENIESHLPQLSIADAGIKIPYKNKYFDFIFSQATTQYIADKAHFLEEVNRVLTKQGIAIIEMQNSKSPPGYENIFEIWKSKEKNEKPILFKDFIKGYDNIKINKSSQSSGWSIVILKKSKTFKLGLRLVYSIDLHKINSEWWGTKSVYVLKK